ncbi:magnesium transporter CorA family protein [Romboutsia sp.]|uniref:magnesium transporter CorA family protein n=1 Tax=Romboutsia sp. TaxID=1965302 RepID=UPI003F419697
MYILNLNTREKNNEFKDDFYNKEHYYLILSDVNELKLIKDILEIDEITFNDCLKFDENIKLDLFDNYDFLSVNTFEINNDKVEVEEVNMYLSDNFILVVCKESHFIFDVVKCMIMNNIHLDNYPGVVNLYKITYIIFKTIIIREFENLEKLEDIILDLEDNMMNGINDNHIININYIRGITRTVVKTIRPLLYIGDRILKENIRYLKYSDMKKYNLDNLQGIDIGIDKLYKFALSTRELADKLLDIYSSKVAEKTNSLITKLTLLTGIAAPLTIITGIYGMNFKEMPELDYVYGYPIVLGMMVFILIVGVIIFKLKKLL